MRVAPPAQAWCRSGGWWQRLQQLIYGLSTAAGAFWAGAQLGIGAAWLLPAALGLGLGAAWLAGRLLQAHPVELIWDGTAWCLRSGSGDPQSGRALPMLDLGAWLLLRFDAADPAAPRRSRWLALARRDAPAGWPALRVALYAQ
jgi:hypothetical protein